MKFKFYAFKLSFYILLVFLAQIFISGFTEFFILDENFWNEPWRFLTSIFLHGGVGHLAYNLFALVLFGSILEKLIGGKRFLMIFFVTGILANLVSVNFYSSALGASGAIFGVIGALMIIRPLLPIWAFGLPMPIFVAGIIWVTGDVIGAVGFLTGSPMDNNVGNIAHLSGVIFGILIGMLLRKNFRKARTKKEKIVFDERSIRNWEDRHLK